MSFWLDWWLLFVFGFIIHVIVKAMGKSGKISEYNLKWIKRIMMLGILSCFFLISVGFLAGFTLGTPAPGDEVGPYWMAWLTDLFFRLMRGFYAPYYAIHPLADSTEFMFSSGQPWLRDLLNIQFNDLFGLIYQPLHLFIGICLFATYPYLLFLGTYVAELILGSKYGKNALWKIAWPLLMIVMMIVVPLIMNYSLQASIIADMLPLLIVVAELGIAAFFIIDFMLVLRKK